VDPPVDEASEEPSDALDLPTAASGEVGTPAGGERSGFDATSRLENDPASVNTLLPASTRQVSTAVTASVPVDPCVLPDLNALLPVRMSQ